MEKLYIAGFLTDIDRELENLEREKNKYEEINLFVKSNGQNYDNLLLELTTAELKQVIGLLTKVLKEVKDKGFDSIENIFQMFEDNKLNNISIFYCYRILEKNINDKTNIAAYKKLVDIFIKEKNGLQALNHLINLLVHTRKYILENTNKNKEIIELISDIYKIMFIYYITLDHNKDKALGYAVKNYYINKLILSKYNGSFKKYNNILLIINILGLYSSLENSIQQEFFDLKPYINDFILELRILNNFPKLKQFYYKEYKKYLSEFLFNIYILGFEDEFGQISKEFPDILSKKHKLLIDIESKEDILKIEKDMEKFFNNASLSDKEDIFFVFINKFEKEEALKKLEKYKSYFKNSLIIEILKMKFQENKDYDKLKNLKIKALSEGNFKVAKIIDSIIED